MCKNVIINRKQFWIEFSIISVLILIPNFLKADIINIPLDQPSIQAGIDLASYFGDTVLVDTGTYTENIDFSGKFLVVASKFLINKDPYYILNTVIDGSNPAISDSASCVRFQLGEDSSVILEGFTLTGGSGTKWIDPQYPSSTWRGGGIFIFQSSPTIRNNLIVENEVKNITGVDGAQGGELLTYGGNPLIQNNTIMSNKALYGAGIWTLGNGTFPIIINNNTIVENSAIGSGAYGGKGGAMFIWVSNIEGSNNIIWENTQTQGGPIAEVGGGQANIIYSDIEGGFSGVGNIDENPIFEDSLFILSNLSPCIDSGNSDSLYNDPEDSLNIGFALFPSKGGLRNDMGAYGGPYRKELQFLVSAVLEEDYNNINLNNYLFVKPFPNSLNQMFTINYIVSEHGYISLKVFDLLGRKIESLVNKYDNSGNYELIYDANDLIVGPYFLVYQTNDFIDIKKFFILK